GDYARAVEVGATLLEMYPDDTTALYELADSYRLTGDCENAQAIVDVAVVSFPDDARFADVAAGCNGETSQATPFECDPNTDFEATITDLNGDWAQILPVAQCWVQSQPDNGEANITLGDAYWSVGEVEKSLEAYQQALALAPEDVYLLTSVADAYNALGDYDACLENVNYSLELDPQNNYTLAVATRCSYGAGDYARAVEIGATLLELYPGDTNALYELADSYRLTGDCNNALAIVESASVLLPDDTRFADIEAGCTNQTLGADCDPNTDYQALYATDMSDLPYEEARNILLCAIQADPANRQFLLDLMQLDYGQGNPESALLYGSMLLEQNPSDFIAISFLAWGYGVTGQTYECYQLAKPMLSFLSEPIEPEFTTTIDHVVVMLKCAYVIGDIDLIVQLASFVSRPESDGILAYVLARHIGADPQYVLELAQSAYDKANEQNLESPYPSVGLAFALFANGRADEAIAIMNEGVDRFPTSYMYAMRAELYAIIYYNLDPVDAYLDNYFADIQTALEIDPTDAWGLLVAGMTGANDAETVVSYGEQVMALYPYIRWAFGATVTSYTLPEECEAMIRYIDTYLVYYPNDEVALYYRNDPERCGNVTIETTSAECDPNTDFEATIADLNGDLEQIISVATCWVQSQPDNVVAHTVLGDTYWYAGDYENALLAYQAGVEQFPTDVYLLTSTADTYWGMGNNELCLENVTVALEVDPQYAYAQEIAMHCLYNLGDYARVIEIGTIWRDLYPDFTSSLFDLADSYRLTGDCENALVIVEDAKTLVPDDTRFADIEAECGG
ncbi:MAG: tetratricopeptide repeat protein, partial [bacterium]|nr:tetratricopeptide repeat protein [bacterium]